ncbi:hypothetical protein ACOSP7_021429 [Xanthoceras sorbifolium]
METSEKASLADCDLSDEIQELLLTLLREKTFDGSFIYKYEGVWYRPIFLAGLISSQKHFHAEDSDTIVITFPKSGTTWLKALTYATVHRSLTAMFDSNNSPLLTTNSHDLAPFLDLAYIIQTTIFGTLIPYSLLLHSIKNSNCRIVYMCRNPFDQFISHWKYLQNARDQDLEPNSLEEAFELVCQGIQPFGPFLGTCVGLLEG